MLIGVRRQSTREELLQLVQNLPGERLEFFSGPGKLLRVDWPAEVESDEELISLLVKAGHRVEDVRVVWTDSGDRNWTDLFDFCHFPQRFAKVGSDFVRKCRHCGATERVVHVMGQNPTSFFNGEGIHLCPNCIIPGLGYDNPEYTGGYMFTDRTGPVEIDISGSLRGIMPLQTCQTGLEKFLRFN